MDINKITEKITLPVAIVIAAIVLVIGFFAVQYVKQQSIERQQAIKLQEDKVIEEARAEQAQKEYIAKRKADCLDIYKTESDKWNNVNSWNYIEPAKKDTSNIELPIRNDSSDNGGIISLAREITLYPDTCEIIYKDNDGETFSRYY